MVSNYLIAKNKLQEYKQEHLLKYYNELNENEKEALIQDIINIDFEQIQNLYENINNNEKEENARIEPISYIDKLTLSKRQREYYEEKGIESIKNGEYAVITMAGGQRY